MAASDNLHPQLFDTTPYHRELTPEEKGPDAWMEHHAAAGTLQHHGTFRDEWRDAPVIHSGTMGQASYRLGHIARLVKGDRTARQTYYHPDTPDDGYDDIGDEGEPMEHVGRVYAFRMSGGVHPEVLRDRDANDADYAYQRGQGYDDWEVSRSVKESMSDEGRDYDYDFGEVPSTPHTQALEAGQALPYDNRIESNQDIDPRDTPPVSHVVPKRSVTTWENDVLANPHASELAKQYSQQRIRNRTAGSVAFPDPGGRGDWNVQSSLLGRPDPSVQAGRRNLSSIQFTTEEE
jgi:hypothetical protein